MIASTLARFGVSYFFIRGSVEDVVFDSIKRKWMTIAQTNKQTNNSILPALSQHNMLTAASVRAEERAQIQASACVALPINAAGGDLSLDLEQCILPVPIIHPRNNQLVLDFDSRSQKLHKQKSPAVPDFKSSAAHHRSKGTIMTDDSKHNTTTTTSTVVSASSEDGEDGQDQIQQDEIDQLRNRVDSVLNQLVKSSVNDTHKLQQQVQELRMGGPEQNSRFLLSPPITTTTTTAEELIEVPQELPTAYSSATDIVQNTTKAKHAAKSRQEHQDQQQHQEQQQAQATTSTNNNNNTTDQKETKWVVDPYGDQGEYAGELDAEGLPKGQGTMQYTDGRIYNGEWRQGQWHGTGEAVFMNQDVFQGMYHQDQRHGYGTYKWNDGRVYAGEFCMDQRQGQGTYRWPDGARYEGEFHKGLRHGEGRYTFTDNSVYTGEWRKGKYHGVGECHWADGRTYKGEWATGKAHGYGVEMRPDGSIRHDGEWQNDNPIRK